MATAQELASFQATQLADLDKKLALWDQRLKQIDQKIATTTQALQDSVTQLKTNMQSLVAAADEWLSYVSLDPDVSKELQQSVVLVKDKIVKLYAALDAPVDATTLTGISELSGDLQALSATLLQNMSAQATVFAQALEQATADLLTHYGIQI